MSLLVWSTTQRNALNLYLYCLLKHTHNDRQCCSGSNKLTLVMQACSSSSSCPDAPTTTGLFAIGPQPDACDASMCFSQLKLHRWISEKPARMCSRAHLQQRLCRLQPSQPARAYVRIVVPLHQHLRQHALVARPKHVPACQSMKMNDLLQFFGASRT